MSATQTVNFIPPGSFTAIQSNIATLQTGTANLQTNVTSLQNSTTTLQANVLALTGTVSNSTTYYNKIGSENIWNPLASEFKNPGLDCWEFVKIYENLKNCMTGPNSTKKQRALADDDPNNLYSTIFNIPALDKVEYKLVTMATEGVDGLAKQLLAVGKIIHPLYFGDYLLYTIQYKYSQQLNLSDSEQTMNNLIPLVTTMRDYCTELINGAYGELDAQLKNYIVTLRLWFKSDLTAYSNTAIIQNGYYPTYVPGFFKAYPASESLYSAVLNAPNPNALCAYYLGGPLDPKLSVVASQNMPNFYTTWVSLYNQWLQEIKKQRSTLPEFGAPLCMWGATDIDPYYGSNSNNISTILQLKDGVANGDGMGNTLPTGTYSLYGPKVLDYPYAGPVLAFNVTGTFENYTEVGAAAITYALPDSSYIIDSLSDLLSTQRKQQIYNECKYVYENVCQPIINEIEIEQQTTFLTNAKQFYDKDLWCNRWRYLIPGEILYCTGPSGPVEGTYTACVVNMTGVSSSSLAKLIADGASYLNESQKIVLVPFTHPNIEQMTQAYTKFLQVVNCVFEGDTYISTYQITGTLNYNNYPNYSSILDNYSVNVFTATGVNDLVTGITSNGESSNQFVTDIKYSLANNWIKYDYALSGSNGIFGGATGIDSYLPGTPLINKYNAIISNSLSEQNLVEEIKSDLDIYGYNYGYIPPGITGAAGDIAPVYVSTGFSAPTFGTLSSQRDNSKGFTTQVRESLNTVYDVNIPMYFIYRQHYKIHLTGATGVKAGQPLNSSNVPTNNFRTEYATTIIYNSLRRSTPLSTRCTYLAQKQGSVMEKQTLASWNQALVQQDIYNTGFINNYLLTSTGSSKYMKFRAQERSDAGAYSAAGGTADPSDPTNSYIFLGQFGNASPYGGSKNNFNANLQVFNHELAFGHGVQNLVQWYQLNTNTIISPWTTNGQYTSSEWASIPGSAVNSAVNFEGWATFGEFLSFCQGYQYNYNLTTNTVNNGIGPNYAGYIVSMNSSNRIPARQVCDPKFNLPQYGWSLSKLMNTFNDITGLGVTGIRSYIARFIGSEGQQTTYNFGFCVNLAARNILKNLLGSNYDQTKYTQFRIEQTSYFVSTDILDYVTQNYMLFSK